MKHAIICCFLFFMPAISQGQKQGNIWYFSGHAGMDFTHGVPVLITGGQTGGGNTQEGTSCIADSAGNLLFYSDATAIFNRNHQVMTNSVGLFGNTSSTQGCIIVPKPGSDSLFYVFTSDAQENYPGNPRGYNYSVVDMCLNNGLGDVISGQKNIHLTDSGTEKLCAAADGQGGYWIMGHKMFTDEFHAWHLTSAGITDTVVSHTGIVHGGNGNVNSSISQMKFNPACTRLALALQNTPEAIMEIFDFNPATGLVNNPCHIVIDTSRYLAACYGLEFSPDGSRLYVGHTAADTFRAIYQFTVTGATCNAIQASKDTICVSKVPVTWFFGMQAGPDGKIYVAIYGVGSIIGCINYPNLTGSAVAYDSAVFTLPVGSFIPLRMFPGFVAGYKYHNGLVGPCAVLPAGMESVARDEIASFFPNPVNGTAILNISPQTDIRAMHIVVKDAVGRIIKTVPVSKHQLSLDLSELAAGAYFYLLLQHNQTVKTDKFLVR